MKYNKQDYIDQGYDFDYNTNFKLNIGEVIEDVIQYKDASEIRNKLRLDTGKIIETCTGKRKMSYGYIWQFNNEQLAKVD